MNEKEQYFFERTFAHIQRVQNNGLYLIKNHSALTLESLTLEHCRQFAENLLIHDRSKFCEAQFIPYMELSWMKKLNPSCDVDLGNAWKDHYTKENHHPERMRGRAVQMNQLEVLEMVCDLQAMAQEFNEGSCRKYFEEIWVKQHGQDFYDDYNWEVTKAEMREAITLLEGAPAQQPEWLERLPKLQEALITQAQQIAALKAALRELFIAVNITSIKQELYERISALLADGEE